MLKEESVKGKLKETMKKYEELMDTVPERFKDVELCLKLLGLADNEKEMTSMFYYTYINDRYNHGYFRYHPNSVLSITQTLKNVENIFHAVQKQKELTLIIASDHGGQNYPGEDEFCNHGCSTPGNEGWMMIYNSKMKNIGKELFSGDMKSLKTIHKF